MALKIKSDCWLIDEKDITFSKSGWTIKVTGPGHHAGSWFKQEIDQQQIWKWVPQNENIFNFIRDNGDWYFIGNKLSFNSDINKWIFRGDNISLYFETDNQKKSFRFRTTNNSCAYAKNSNQALDQISLLVQSYDPKFVPKIKQEPDAVTVVVSNEKKIDEKQITLKKGEISEQEVKSFEGRVEKFGDITIDFSSINLKIKMKKKDSDQEYDVDISDSIDNLIVVKTITETFIENDEVELTANCIYTKTDFVFTLKGIVIELFVREDKTTITTIELNEYKQEELDKLLEVYLKRQENIDEFLKISTTI